MEKLARLSEMQEQRTDKKTAPECPFAPLAPSYLVRDKEFFMKHAYNQALKAWKESEVPVGAVIEMNSQIVAFAHNMVETTKDPTAHAEILAISQAAAKLGDWRLNECTLYVTKEPCPMCSGACVMARLKKVVYAVPDPKMGFLGGALKIHEVPTLNHHLEVECGVLAEQCQQMIKTFFMLKRKSAENADVCKTKNT